MNPPGFVSAIVFPLDGTINSFLTMVMFENVRATKCQQILRVLTLGHFGHKRHTQQDINHEKQNLSSTAETDVDEPCQKNLEIVPIEVM